MFQGSPLVLCVAIFLLDSYGSCDLILPSMGVAQCFLGYPWGDQWQYNSSVLPAFFFTPEFIYFHFILVILQIINIILFILTTSTLINHWRRSVVFMRGESRRNFLIVVKLFFIMGEYCQTPGLVPCILVTSTRSSDNWQCDILLPSQFYGTVLDR